MLLGLLFPWPARTALVVAAGLSQIGEFSFILGQAGVSLGLLDQDQYSLILAGALFSITMNPLMFRLINPAERLLRSLPKLWKTLDRHGPAPAPLAEEIAGHVVIVGFGRVGHHMVDVLGEMAIPLLVVEVDAERVAELGRRRVASLFGDAANSEVLLHAGLSRARALVVTVPDEAASELVVAAARGIAPELPIIVRAASNEGVKRLAQLGAQHVIHPEMEGGLEIVRRTFLQLGFPLRKVYQYADAVRRDHYDLQVNTEQEHRLLLELLDAAGSIEIAWLRLPPGNPLVGLTLAEAKLRAQTGASVVAIMRNRQLLANPKSMTVFAAEDRIGLIGDQQQIAAAERLIAVTEATAAAAGSDA
jgi:CPA2 family monovalent cation:H+ antiporter-2